MEWLRKTLGLFLSGLTFLGLVLATNVQTLASPTVHSSTVEVIARSPTKIPTVSVSQLPPEARKTINLIKRGGPFPYRMVNRSRNFSGCDRVLARYECAHVYFLENG